MTWFPAAPGALPLGRVSNITNPFWEMDQFEYSDGDLPLSSVVPTGKPIVRPGTGRGHVCGTDEDFREGGLYEPLEPPATYGVQGLPTCCGAPVLLGGGVRDGGAVGVVFPLVPGSDCATALLFDVGVPQVITIPGPGIYWVKASSVGEVFMHHLPEQLTGAIVGTGGLRLGSGCTFTLGPTPCSMSVCFGIGISSGTEIYVAYTVTSGSGTMRVTFGSGACPP